MDGEIGSIIVAAAGTAATASASHIHLCGQLTKRHFDKEELKIMRNEQDTAYSRSPKRKIPKVN